MLSLTVPAVVWAYGLSGTGLVGNLAISVDGLPLVPNVVTLDCRPVWPDRPIVFSVHADGACLDLAISPEVAAGLRNLFVDLSGLAGEPLTFQWGGNWPDLFGDVNGDGTVDLIDVATVKACNGVDSFECLQSCDVTRDGRVTLSDMALVKNSQTGG